MLKLVEFIKNNPETWEKMLRDKPYCISVKRKGLFLIFNYSQIDSNFSYQLVRECRGIILEDVTFKPVCVPFFKFFNHNEKHSDIVDWSTAKVQEKIDGSIIKVWNFEDKWHISTNSMIDARDATLANGDGEILTFYDLFMHGIALSNIMEEGLDKDNTYMFEITSKYNKHIVPYDDITITHIGTRNNITLMECDEDIGIKKPNEYHLTNLEDCLDIVKIFPFTKEGYVVVDKYYNRIKIKSPAYLSAHYLKNNGCITKKRIIDMIKQEGTDEFLGYFPEYKKAFDDINYRILFFDNELSLDMEYLRKNTLIYSDSKKFADYALSTICPTYIFLWKNVKTTETPTKWLMSQTADRIVEILDKADELCQKCS